MRSLPAEKLLRSRQLRNKEMRFYMGHGIIIAGSLIWAIFSLIQNW
jgi:hypothetical protein